MRLLLDEMVNALAHFLSSPDAAQQPFNRAHYLRKAPDEEWLVPPGASHFRDPRLLSSATRAP